ncbi:cation transporter, partial [Salmonella enterica subsp. enterica serovar Typhimurium]
NEALNNELRLTLSKIISKNLQELEVVNSTLKVIEKQIKEEDIYSPVDCVIYKINKCASTHGCVIQAADLLFEIKPKVRT